MAVAGAALLLGEVDLQVGVPLPHVRQTLERQRGEHGPTEGGVQHDAGGVDDRAEGEYAAGERLHHPRGEYARVEFGRGAGEGAPPLGVEDLACAGGQARAGDAVELGPVLDGAHELVDRRQLAQPLSRLSLHRGSPRLSRGPS